MARTKPHLKFQNHRNPCAGKDAKSYLYNHKDIKDVFQDTLIKLYENIHMLKNLNYFETWYISILINEYIFKNR